MLELATSREAVELGLVVLPPQSDLELQDIYYSLFTDCMQLLQVWRQDKQHAQAVVPCMPCTCVDIFTAWGACSGEC